MANKKQLVILKKGVKEWNEWRKKNPDTKIDLSEAALREATLFDVDFYEANLGGANLGGTRLCDANLRKANLRGAYISDSFDGPPDIIEEEQGDYYFNANLDGADLREADLREANLNATSLMEANLSWATLSGADLSYTIVRYTIFGAVDLSEVKGLETVNHFGPSIIGIDSIYKSRGNIPEAFLRGCGVPEDMIAYARSLRGKAIDFYSCFISHSAKDKRFCERLYADLQAKGVRVWYFPEDAKWGETVWGEIDRSIKIYDKLIVVCSENSLQSSPVNREIDRALEREDKERKNILFPISIDDYIFAKDAEGNDKWQHPRRADVIAKVVGDFSGWDKDVAKYDKAFDKLLKGLQAESARK